MLNNVIECAREAGSIALQYFRQDGGIGVENKLNDSDIVTVADKASETCIKQYIGIEHKGRKEIGVVYAPALDELFYAERGKGAYLNGRRIHVSSEDHMSRSVISTGFPVDKNINPDNNMDNLEVILPKVRDIRRLGSAAVDMCYVAAGLMQGYWEMNLHEWDINASTLILEEAGGYVTRFREDRGISLVCGNRAIHDQLLSLLKK